MAAAPHNKAKVKVMVKTIVTSSFSVHVSTFREGESGGSLLCEQRDMDALDAFDYAIQAQGYFRFAIQEMDCHHIEIEIADTSSCVHLIEITRD